MRFSPSCGEGAEDNVGLFPGARWVNKRAGTMDSPASDQPAGSFRTTHWTLVLEAAQPNGATAMDAFAQLYLCYWRPLYAYVRRRGLSPADGEDILQDFFARLVSKEALSGVRREGGKFRSFLLQSLNNFLANEWDRAHTQKRGGGQRPLSLDTRDAEAHLALEVPEKETPESLYEKRWAFAVLDCASARLRAEYVEEGKAELFEQLRVYLLGDRGGPRYADVAARRGMSEGAVMVAVHRLRQRYGQVLREEIMRTVASPDEVDAELHHLMKVLGG